MELYEEVNVWEKLNEGNAICYRCLRLLSNGLYYVQSADHYYKSTDHAEFESQFAELFIEEAPRVRTSGYPTLQAAISAFKEEME